MTTAATRSLFLQYNRTFRSSFVKRVSTSFGLAALLLVPTLLHAQNYEARVQVYAPHFDSTYELSQLTAIEFSLAADSSLTVYFNGGKTSQFNMHGIDSLIFSPDTTNTTLTFLFANGTDSTYLVATVDSIVIPPIITSGVPTSQTANERIACYPNPSTGTVSIALTLEKPERIHLALFDEVGKLVRDFGEDYFSSGSQSLTWDGLDDQGQRLPSATYVLQLEGSDTKATLKLSLTR